jgi:hypothetical protein
MENKSIHGSLKKQEHSLIPHACWGYNHFQNIFKKKKKTLEGQYGSKLKV